MRSVRSRPDEATQPPIDPTLVPFFKPRGIAILGVSADPHKLGFNLARNLVQSGYAGAIGFVNPKGGNLFERPIYESITNVPEPVDLAVLLIPADLTPGALKDCGVRGIRAAIIASAGFRETGDEGEALEKECLHVAKAHHMRLMGPNCVGILDTHLPFDTTFLPLPGPLAGEVAFLSHSGAICTVIAACARNQGLGLSHLVSLGNQIDITETELLAPVAEDPETRVITLYLEGLRQGRRFVEKAQRIGLLKPIVALKVGRSESGSRAAFSHTGALAGKETAYQAAFRRAGIIRADTSEQLLDFAQALAWCPLPRGKTVAILTNAGGLGVTAADALESHDLQLTQLTEPTQRALRDLLAPAASILNPVDMLASATPEQYATSLRILLEDPGVDSVMVILPPPPISTVGAIARAMSPIARGAEKPVVVTLMGDGMIQEAVDCFHSARVPEYRLPERAAAALAILSQRVQYLARKPTAVVPLDHVQPEAVQSLLSQETSSGPLDPLAAIRILKEYGIPVLGLQRASSTGEAVTLAQQVGFPVALKVASPSISHKTDVGGVLLNLDNEQAVAEAFERLIQKVSASRPQAEILGADVQPMAPQGHEVIIGALQDPQFGPMVSFGSGGVEVEELQDIDFALAPLSRSEAEQLLENTWAGAKLRGYRNVPAADREAVLDVLLRMAQLAADFPQLAEIEINPLRVLPQGEGTLALDVRIQLDLKKDETP
jgi:acetyltransferase